MYRRFKHLKFKAVSRQNIYSERTDLDKATAETWVTELLASMDAMDQRAWRLLYELRLEQIVYSDGGRMRFAFTLLNNGWLLVVKRAASAPCS